MVGRGPILLLVETHSALRTLIHKYLDQRIGVPVVEAASAGEAVAEARRCQPVIILTDLSASDHPGPEYIQMLRAVCPEARIVLMGSQPESVYVAAAAEMPGVSAYVCKELLVTNLAATLWPLLPDRDLSWTFRVAWRYRMLRETVVRPLCRKLAGVATIPAQVLRWLDENAWPGQPRPRFLYLANVVGWVWVFTLAQGV